MIRWLYFFLLFPTIIFAQQNPILLQACVVDDVGIPVNDAHVTVEGLSNIATATEENGCFTLAVSEFPLQLSISHINFKAFSIALTRVEDLPPILILESAINALPDITVRANIKIDTVYQQPYSVTDYVFYQDHLILMACKNTIDGFSLILLDKEEKEVHDFSLREVRPKSLYYSCDDKLYLITGANVKEILVEEERIKYGRTIPRDEFSDGLANCVLANDSLAYFQKYFYQGQALQYSAWSRFTEESTEIKLPLIENDRNMVLLVEETGNRMPWSGDLWEENISDRLKELRDSRYQLAGIMKIFYPPINAPLYAKDSTICIFNHFASEIQYFNTDAELLSTVPINYHLHKKWSKEIYYDTYLQQAYTAFDTRFGIKLFPVDLQTGQLGLGVEIPMDFIEKVKIWNGSLYFLYRNMGRQEWNRKLHRIRL